MGIAASMRVGIHLGAGNAEQAHVSARVTICFGCKYLHGKSNACERYFVHRIPLFRSKKLLILQGFFKIDFSNFSLKRFIIFVDKRNKREIRCKNSKDSKLIIIALL